jgi:hypothetical protein
VARFERSSDGRGRTRGEITAEVEESDQSMQEQLEEMEKGDADVQTVRETLGSLEFGGTSEGNDAVQSALDDAESVGVVVFDEKDGKLDELQDENEGVQDGLRDQTDADEKDEQGVSDAGGRIAFEQTLKALDDVKRQINDDIEFLKSHIEQAMNSVAESEAKQQEHRDSVHSKS